MRRANNNDSADHSTRGSYRPISLLSPTAKLLEKIILPYITNNIPSIYHQHGFKTKHSTTTALHQLTNHITTGFNQKKPPHRTITIALDMSQAFDTVNHYTLIEKLINTNTPNLITRFTRQTPRSQLYQGTQSIHPI